MGGRGASSATASGAAARKKTRGHITSEELEDAGGAVNYLMREMGYEYVDMPEAFYEAIQDWTGAAYEQIRLMDRIEMGTAPQQEIVRLAKMEPSFREKRDAARYYLERYIDEAPKWSGGETYRGVRGSYYKDISIGDVISMGGTSSWTSKIAIAEDFAKWSESDPIVFVSPTQRKGTSIAAFSTHDYEAEVIVPKDVIYRVDKIEYRNDGSSRVKYVYLTEAS